jgi:hypothetical protein
VPPGWGFLDLPNGTQRYVRRGPITNSAFLSTLRDWFRCLRLTQGLRPGLNYSAAPRLERGGTGTGTGAKARPFREAFSRPLKGRFSTLCGHDAVVRTLQGLVRPRSDAAFSVVPPGLVPLLAAYPGLAPWARLFRRSSGGASWHRHRTGTGAKARPFRRPFRGPRRAALPRSVDTMRSANPTRVGPAAIGCGLFCRPSGTGSVVCDLPRAYALG